VDVIKYEEQWDVFLYIIINKKLEEDEDMLFSYFVRRHFQFFYDNVLSGKREG
jgi:hypothetical protein